MAYKKKAEVKTKGLKDPVSTVVNWWDKHWNYASSSYHHTWQNMQSLYDSKRVYVGYNGISDTFVPMSFSTVETMVSAVSGEKPLVEYFPTKPEQATNTDVLNALYSYYWDLDNWTNKKVQSSRIYFKLGSYVEYYYWNIDHPCMRVIPLRDFFCDPNATILNYQEAAYMGHRFLASRSELEKEMIVDPEKKDLVKKYYNLNKLTKFSPGDQTDKQYKDTQMGSMVQEDDDQIEVICAWTKDETWYIGNRQEVIYHAPNTFKQRQQFLGYRNPTGMYPYVLDSFLADESLLYGKSVLESIAKPQELLNDLTNQNIDAASWALDPAMELDPQYSSYIEKIKNVTGAIYPFKPGSYSPVQKPIVPANIFNERANIKNEIRETTAIDEIIKGISTPSRTTATEVKAQVASAGRRFDMILSQLESGGYYQGAKLVFQMVKLYVTAPVMFRVVGKEGVNWQQFDPKQFDGDYEPRVKLQATINSEKQKKMRDLKEMYSAFIGNPLVDQSGMTRLVLQKAFDLDPDEVNKLMVPADKVSPPKPEKSPEEIALEGIVKDYSKAMPDVRAQIEEMAGLEPSAAYEGEIEKVAAEQFATSNEANPGTFNLEEIAKMRMPEPQETQAEPTFG